MRCVLATLILSAGLQAAPVPSSPGSLIAPKEGDPVDLSPWAYPYRKDSPANPPEAQWLWPHKVLRWDWINGSLVWYYDNSSDDLPKGIVLAGLLWEEPRDVKQVTVEFPGRDGHVPEAGQVLIACRSAAAVWEDSAKRPPYSVLVAEETGHPSATPQGTTVFRFNLVCDPFTKLYVIYNGGDREVAIPVVHAYGKAKWRKESTVDVEWGVGPDHAGKQWDHRVEAYNGVIDGTEPLAAANGRSIRLHLFQTDDPGNNRTLVTFLAGKDSFTMAARDLDEGPVLVPGAGFYLERSGGGISASDFARQLAGKGMKTTRETVETQPEESWESAMTRFHGNQRLPDFPTPPYEPAMKIDVPERALVRQWRLGAWHLRRWCQKLGDGSIAVSIWPYDKSIGGNEGMVALGSESFLNIRVLDWLGFPDVAEGGLNYWLFGPHARPFLWYADAMGDDALTSPFNSPNHRSPGYDQKHASGHGRIMAAAASHYRLTRDDAWWQRASPVLERAGLATLRLRDRWNATQPPGAWTHGLMPPGNISDNNNTRLFYGLCGFYYQGLRDVADILEKTGVKSGPDEAAAAAGVGRDLRSAVERSLALTQVVKVGDGTYRRDFSYMPCIRGLGIDIDSSVAGNNRYYDAKMGALTLVETGVLDPNEAVVQELLDVYEDRLVRDGQNDQNSYNNAPAIYLARDDIPMFLRGMYNSDAAELLPSSGYIFVEGRGNGNADDKTFEEAGFLRSVRQMLVMEDGGALWLARGTPRAWLEQGKRIAVSHAPTFFGETGYRIESDVANGSINAVVDVPSREAPGSIMLKLRHPTGAKMKGVRVNGRPWTDFDPIREIVVLKGLSGRVTVSARY